MAREKEPKGQRKRLPSKPDGYAESPERPERSDRPTDDDAAPAALATASDDSHVRELEAELDTTRQRLQAIIQEYETSQEEMKASNEELQSANEELRSRLEELETSKEELQTVNQENRHKVEELAQLSSDLQNLMAATDIATLFLDRDLRIMRLTPKVGDIFNVCLPDRGRPLSDLTHRLGYDSLGRDARKVLDTLVPIEREVQDDEERWYLMRFRPYRTPQDRIQGVVITLVDITDRKRAEEDLRRSEEFHRRAVDAAHVGTWDFALESGQASLSEQKARLLGLAPHETKISYARLLELTHPDDRERLEAALADSRERRRPFELDFRILAGREVRWLHTKGGMAADVDEPHLHGASVDITALKRAEAALRESERQYKTLFESIDEGFCVMEVLFDEHDRPVDAQWIETNPAFERHTGLVDVVGKRAKELVPGQRDFWIETYGRIALTGEPKQFVEESSAVGRWFEIEAFRVGEPRQRRVGLLVRDITERRRQAEEIRRANEVLEQQVDARARQLGEQEQRFRRLVESAAQVTWTADREGSVAADSSLWQEFTGQDPEATENGRWLKMIHPDDRTELLESWTRAVEEQGSFEGEARVRHAASGAYRWMAIRAVPLPSETGEVRGWFGMGLDIDELKRAEERIRTMAGKLTAAERHERHRIAQVLHDDLQQLLYSIQMKLQLARNKQEEGGAVDSLLDQVDWSLGMLEEAIAKTRHLTIDLSPPLLAGEGIVAALRWLRAPMHDLHHLDVELYGDASIGVASEDVANLVFQVVRELLFNVAKHARTDRAVIDVKRVGPRVRVTVSDEGVGFDARQARLEHDDEAAFGLLSARERLRLRGGDLEIDSEPGRGTRVVVYAPGSPKS